MALLADKVAIITGAGTGIGRCTARRMASEGASIVATDIDEASALETALLITESGGTAIGLRHDVTDESRWVDVVNETKRQLGGVDILFNNAGIYVIAPLTEITLETWNSLMAVNVTGTFLGMKHTVSAMVERGGGAIINASSVAGLRGVAGHTLYGASKGAVRIMTKDVAAEYAMAGIRVNSIHPTYTKTAMAEYGAAAAGSTTEELGARMVPMGRLAEVGDVADVVVFLASDRATYLTGGEFVIDGGAMNTIML